MPTSIREQILAAFLVRLQTIANVTVERNRVEPVEVFPSLLMIDGGQSVTEENSGFKLHALRVELEGYVSAATAAELGPALSDLHGQTVLALMANRTLGDLAIDLREGELSDPEIDRTQGHRPFAAFSLAFEIDYFTDPSDPYQPAP
jgi:hypothetical protein